MPTTHENINTIRKIIREELPTITNEQLAVLFKRINEESGELSTNESYKISTRMLRTIYEKPKVVYTSIWVAKIFLPIIITIHFFIIAGNILAALVLPFVTPWYIALPLCTFVVWLTFSPISCPLTRLETRIRMFLGLERVEFFVKHYIINPLKKLLLLVKSR